jgi:hypothetical protein
MPYTQQQTGLSVGIDGSKDTLPIAPYPTDQGWEMPNQPSSWHGIVSELPELGCVSHRAIAALVGLAPVRCESGAWVGRARVRWTFRDGLWRVRCGLLGEGINGGLWGCGVWGAEALKNGGGGWCWDVVLSWLCAFRL